MLDTLIELFNSNITAFKGLFLTILGVIIAHSITSIMAGLIKMFVLKKDEKISRKEFYEFVIDSIRYVVMFVVFSYFAIIASWVYNKTITITHFIVVGAILCFVIAAVAMLYMHKKEDSKNEEKEDIGLYPVVQDIPEISNEKDVNVVEKSN